MLIVEDSDNKEQKHVNIAKMKDIKWELMQDEIKKEMLPYNEFIKKTFYSKEYIKTIYPTEEYYNEQFSRFFTYAVLTPDGTWYEPGKMGWWGISFATPQEEKDFKDNYEEKFIKKVDPEWTLTIVDCHI